MHARPTLRRALLAALASALLLAGAPMNAVADVAAPVTPAPATDDVGRWGERLAAVQAAKQINYYPSAAGWTKMWTAFDPATVDADLARAAALGANSVRANLFPSIFGYPTPKPEYTAKLAQFVSLAAAHDMTVKLTLFDWWDGYTDITGSSTWAAAVLAPYRYDSRIISIDLQNELHPDNAAAVAWAKQLLPVLRTAAPATPVTISVSASDGTAGLAKLKAALTATPLDYYDFHFYATSERALAILREAQAAVAPTPLVIGETGLSSLTSTEGEQAAYLARVFQAAAVAGIRSVAPWTLTDFAAGTIPDSAVAKIPAQYQFGLYRTDGTAKPVAAVVKAAWTGTAYPADLLDLGFENAANQTPWRPYLPELGVATKTQAVAHTGTWSVSLSNTGKTAAGSPSYRVSPITPVQPGQKWHAEVYARGNAATGTTQIALSWFDATDKWLGGTSSAALAPGTTGWTKLTVDDVAPAGAASLQVHLKSGANTGTVWFDDVAMSVS
ncbi:glycosyl hydrolase [Actinoplanes sp. KI2]|uniref:cellulase family glycosylhydrolase n=1 Tax=Actinoplanes sp. KI2 TaxID=2983315 RepID=UPI0021D570F8|nr:cellulase family glycosylhydrolase [Actinoplanes sp. KI2]MCU7729313.1 glycosyl hydrolase [Actinoplanes sp. KI2]